ncbi:hypothetical protein C8J56DRAFT_231672 [Mycena floridula]|nr:hypothetical protein C8J56DRAFT_231672 [Mycena floridula]
MALFKSCYFRRLSTGPASIPWFVDPPQPSTPTLVRHRLEVLPPLPEEAPRSLKELHSELSKSPYLEPSTLLITRPITAASLPETRHRAPAGRRRVRGGAFPGDSAYDVPGGLWSWILLAQVKDGTEDKGSIESVVRAVRRILLQLQPPLPLPPNSKRRMHNGWAMVDAGDFAIHVMSRDLRETYFGHIKTSV